MQIGDLVRKYTSIKGVYNYGIVLEVSESASSGRSGGSVKVAWANSNPKNPWIMTSSVEVVNAGR